jgi:hypothetical protein
MSIGLKTITAITVVPIFGKTPGTPQKSGMPTWKEKSLMNKPMTLKEADDWETNFLSNTCVDICKNCLKSVYFPGDIRDSPKYYICPYCDKRQENSFYFRKTF